MSVHRDPIGLLADDAGEWDADVTVRRDPDSAPVHVKGRLSRRLLGGRWLVVDYRTESGYEGHGVYGWDEVALRYTGVWVDPMQPAIARSEGSWDEASHTLTYETVASDGQKSYRYCETFQRLDDGSQLYRNVMPGADGRDLEMVRSVYRRVVRRAGLNGV